MVDAVQRTFSSSKNPITDKDGGERYTVVETTGGGWVPVSNNMTKEEMKALFKKHNPDA